MTTSTRTDKPMIRPARRASLFQQHEGATDGQLLERFVVDRDQAAFAVLVQRYGPLVLGVCRRKLQHEQDAEDAFQATFLVLARKAAAIARWDLLGNWLYGVASRTAMKARSRGLGRRLREKPLPEQAVAASAAEPTINDVRPVLDDEVNQLPSKYRMPFVLCYLEGKTNDEAARHLGCPKGTVQSRLAWARARLRRRLAVRGLALSSEAPLIAVIQDGGHALVPRRLIEATASAACRFTLKAAVSGAISAPVAGLAEGVLKTMFLTKLAVATVVTISLLLFGASAGLVALRVLAEPPAPAGDDGPQNAQVEHKRTTSIITNAHTLNGRKIVTEKEIVSRSFRTSDAPRIIVDVSNGPIAVIGQSDNVVDVAVTKEGGGYSAQEAKEALKKVQVETRQEGNTVRVTARLEHAEHENLINTSASAVLKVPARSLIDLHSDFGSIKADGVTGDEHARTTSGSITVKGTKGNLRLVSQFGAIDIEGDSPHIEATTNSGHIRYHGGRADRLDLRTDFGEIEVSGDARNVDAHATSGGIRVRDGQGNLKLESQFGGIDVKGSKVHLSAETSSGSVRFAGTLAEGEHKCVSHFGGITVTLPADTQFAVDADTNFGGVHSDFPVRRSGSAEREQLHGNVGDHPAFRLRLHTDSGGIDIRRQK